MPPIPGKLGLILPPNRYGHTTCAESQASQYAIIQCIMYKLEYETHDKEKSAPNAWAVSSDVHGTDLGHRQSPPSHSVVGRPMMSLCVINLCQEQQGDPKQILDTLTCP